MSPLRSRFIVVPPVLWQTVPFGDQDSWLDFLGFHARQHDALATITGTTFVLTDDLKRELMRHANMHEAVDKVLGIPTTYDLLSYDLNDRASFEGFMQVHAILHQQENIAAGL